MHTDRLETVRASVSDIVPGKATASSPNEQVSTDHHQQMSLARGDRGRSPGMVSGGGGLPYHLTYSMKDVMLPTYPPPLVDRQTPMKIIQLLLRAIKRLQSRTVTVCSKSVCDRPVFC